MPAIQFLYTVLIALAVTVGVSVALTLTVEGAGALWMRDQMRLFLQRSRTTIATEEPTQTEDAPVQVLG